MSDDVASTSKFIFGEATYQKLKFLALILLPAVATFYFTIGTVWEWSNVAKVVGTITAIDTFLGVILGISTKNYNASDIKYDGQMNVITKDDGTKLYSLDLNNDVENLSTKKDITFKVSSGN